MDTDTKIYYCLKNLEETAVKKRSTALTELKQFLSEDKRVIETLNANSSSKGGGSTWQDVFRACHTLVLTVDYEAEEEEKGHVKPPSAQTLKMRGDARICVERVVKEANREASTPHLHLGSTLNICLSVLRKDRWFREKKQNGMLYLSFLSKYIVSFRAYWTEFTAENWRDVADLCMEVYHKVGVKEKNILADMLKIVITAGCAQSPLAIHLKSRLDFFETMFEGFDLSQEIGLQEPLLKLCISLMQALALECRMALCKLGEKILRPILDIHRSKQVNKISLLVYDLLLLQVTLHHPGGGSGEAHNWPVWQGHLHALHSLVEIEVQMACETQTAPTRVKTRQATELSPGFLALAVNVFKQTLGMNEVSQHSSQSESSLDEVSSAKRRRVLVGLSVLIDRLKMAKAAEEVAIRLSVLSALLQSYPDLLGEGDYLNLLQVLAHTQSSCKNHTVMQHLCRCCEHLLRAESHAALSSHERSEVNALWGKVWDMTLRSAGLNQCEEGSHALLRALLSSPRAPLLRPAPLLQLLTSGVVRLTPGSVRTLTLLAEKCHLPSVQGELQGGNPHAPTAALSQVNEEEAASVWDLLLRWLLPPREPEEEVTMESVPPEILAQALVRLTLKTRVSTNQEAPCKPEYAKIITKIETTYSLKALETGIVNQTVKDSNVDNCVPSSVQINNTAHEIMLKFLETEYNFAIEKFENEGKGTNCTDKLVTVRLITNHINLFAHVLSYLMEWNILKDDDLHEFPVKTYLEGLQKILPAAMKRVLELYYKPRQQLEVFEDMYRLYSSKLHETISNLLRSTTDPTTLEHVFMTAKIVNTKSTGNSGFGSDDAGFSSLPSDLPTDTSGSFFSKFGPSCLAKKDVASPFNERGFSIEEKQQLLATKIMANFWFVPNSSWASQNTEGTTSLLGFAINLSEIPTLSKINLQRIFYILKQASFTSSNQIILIMQILKNISRSMKKVQEVVHNILSVLHNMLQQIHDDVTEDKDNRKTVVSILVGFTKLVNKGIFGSAIRVSLIRCLGRIAEVDPEQSWTLKADESCLSADILDFLKDPFNEARLAAAHCVKLLFCSDTPNWDLNLRRKWHKFVFEQMCRNTTTSFENIASRNTAEDELLNLTSSALQSMGVVILTSPQWRKKALFGIMQQAKLQKMNLDLLKGMLEIVCRELKVLSIKQFLGANLKFILTQWLRMYKLDEFPWKLLNCTSEIEFLTTFQSTIIPVLMQYKNNEALEYLCEKINTTAPVVVEQCYAQVISCILPFMDSELDKTSLNMSASDFSAAKILHEELTSHLGEEKLNELLCENLDKIVVCIFQLLHDPTEWQAGMDSSTPLNFTEPDSPHYNHALVDYALLHIQGLTQDPQIPLLVYLVRESPRHIQIILQQLAVAIHDAPTQEDRLKAFLQYAAFTRTLTSHLEGGRLESVTSFVVRDVIHMLLNLIERSESEEEALAISVCLALQDICAKCIDHCKKQLENLLPIITTTLIMVIKKHTNGQVTKQAINILEFLIIENRDELKAVIEKLEPFPQDEKFSRIQTTYHELKYEMRDYDLESEISHFLNAGHTARGNRAEGLLHIRTQLATRKAELKRLYNELHTLRGFSEDCASSILHQLICVLVKLTSDPDSTVSIEAAKCLGELGPSDLSSLVLQPESSSLTCEETSPQVALCRRKLELLKDYLVDSDRSVSVTAAAALYSLLETKEGQQALSSIKDQEYLIPFISKNKVKSIPLTINEIKFIEKLNDNEIWCPLVACDHQTWITKLVCTILETISYSPKYIEQLTAVCKAKESFSVELLPLLVYFILKSDNEVCKDLIVEKMNLIFKKHYEMRERQPSSQRKNRLIYFNKTSVQCMLNVVQFIRGKEHAENAKYKKVTVSCLSLNFLHLAQAAQFCSAYFTSLLYAELWGTERKFRPKKSSGIFSIDEICDDSEDGKALHKILLQGYKKIGDPDAVYGCGMSRLLDTQSRIWYFEHCDRWDKVILMHDIGMGNANTSTSSRGIAIALQQSGLHHLLNSYLEAQETEEMRAMRYECCWRLGQWDLPTVAEVGRDQPAWNIGAQAAYDAHHYSALKSLYNSDVSNLEDDLKNARNCIIQSLAHASLESSKNIYTALSQLQSIQELEDFSNAILLGSTSLNNVLKKWKNQDEITVNQFQYSEPIFSQRIALLDIAVERKDSQDVLQGEIQDGTLLAASVDSLLHLARLSREEKWFHTSEKALRKLGELEGLDREAVLRWKLEESRSLWEQGDKDMGRHRLSSLITQLDSEKINTDSATKLHAQALGLYGNWLEDARSENAHTIIDNYLMEAINVLQNKNNKKSVELIQAYRSLARFADIEYQRVDKYMKSPMFESKFQCMQQSQAVAESMKKELSQTMDKRKAINVNDKQSKLDLNEINNMTQERTEFLELALEYYLRSLDSGLTHEEESTVFRVVSLWLDNRSELQNNAKSFLEEKLKTIPSYKFLPVVPQLVPHISDGSDAFTTTLKTLLVRLSLEHPHHTLPTLLALAELYKDWQFMDVESRPQQPKPEARVEAAQRFIKQLKTKTTLSLIIKQMQDALTALVKFAYYVHTRKGVASADIPSDQPILRLNDFTKMQLSTLSLPVNPAGQYHNVTGIHTYVKKFEMVGGITAPKKIVCVGTDGNKRIQLLKGLDDLHQDAVMQQVFTIMNKLLGRNKRTRDRKLLVRTYKVVPLSQRSGVIEWCENTEPIGGYLLKAHPKLHPGDYQPANCRSRMEKVQRESHEKRLRVYLDICSNLRPVFHHFFTENFLLPGVWFERRLAYTRSVATSSMIGYILGLGDRHVQNILVDKSTAEVIHIDFGIAFEQGLVLNIPETVPFRLTRDMEDGLGISCVEGVFRKSCEKTMEVLRENQETILTILQVLLYDPLYVWTISPERNQNDRKGIKGARDAKTTAVEVNKIAQRALLRLQQKLMGTEEGKSTSVEGQVNRLIQQARDPENLSRLFFGWQPYL